MAKLTSRQIDGMIKEALGGFPCELRLVDD